MFPRNASAILLLLVAATLASGQDLQSTVSPGKTDADGWPTSGATLCLTDLPSVCFQMPDEHAGDVTYQFGLDPHSVPLNWPERRTALLFDATFSAGGSGSLTRYAILREDGSGSATHLSNILPYVALTNNSDEAVWEEPQISHYPVLVTADFIWNFKAGETHFSKHLFNIEVWEFEPDRDRYVRVLAYTTKKKYDGLDAADPINVIRPERPEILRRLHSLNPKH